MNVLGPSLRRRPGITGLIMIIIAVLLLGAAAFYWLQLRRPTSAAPVSRPNASQTAVVKRTTLAPSESWNGTLGHGATTPIPATRQGTITRLPGSDARIHRGSVLFRINEHPVIAMIGTIPMYRDLKPGDTGRDVRQLEANLAALGYSGFDVDRTFTWYTAQAVQSWQKDVGLPITGSVTKADIVFLHGGRVDTIDASIGDKVSPGTKVLELASAAQIVGIKVDTADQDYVPVGRKVTVRLPGDVSAKGTVIQAKTVADKSEDGNGIDATAVKIQVRLDKPVASSLLGAPAEVAAHLKAHHNVLAVPVTALLALSRGGYGLQVVHADGTASIVAVRTGLFTDGEVEVSGRGINAGTRVGVAGR